MDSKELEIMAPAGNFECLKAAIGGGADSVYFGVGRLNMRSHSAGNFHPEDLCEIVDICRENGVKTYMTLNIALYEDDLAAMRETLDAAKKAGVDAVIASDMAAIAYCRSIGMEVHASTQLNISNIEALRFYAQFADVVVLARELNMWQVKDIYDQIQSQHITGPSGQLIRIEMFCHGALCMAISGKCYLSLQNAGRSANRGECVQICRRGYEVRDIETGTQLQIDNKYIMSPKDLKTIRFMDIMMNAGVRVFKIEGRARGPEYVQTVVSAYNEAINSVIEGTFTEEKKDRWDDSLSTVFNRGFWDGYYQGQRLGEWCEVYGSKATEQKVYVGKCMKYFSNIGVAEFLIENEDLHVGDKILITGVTTGALIQTTDEIRFDLVPVQTATRGQHISIKVNEKVRPNDKLYLLVKRTLSSPISQSGI